MHTTLPASPRTRSTSHVRGRQREFTSRGGVHARDEHDPSTRNSKREESSFGMGDIGPYSVFVLGVLAAEDSHLRAGDRRKEFEDHIRNRWRVPKWCLEFTEIRKDPRTRAYDRYVTV